MGPYKVLLADDEEDIRVGISKKMDWASLGFVLVGQAENGREALELAEQLQPDLVLTDIKMPFMDGLELCSILTRRLPASKFVVFSGFDDFDYARQAIGMNVSEYILKPINAAELTAVLRKLRERLDRERTERQDVENLRRLYDESLPTLRNLFLSRLMDGQIDRDRVSELASRHQVCLEGGAFAAAIIHIDGHKDRRELLSLSVQKLFEENFSAQGCVCRPFLYNGSVALLAAMEDGSRIYGVIDAADRVCSLAESYLGLRLTVGVGLPLEDPGDLPRSAEGARNALEYRGLVGKGRTIFIGDLEPSGRLYLSFDENDERELVNAVKLCGEEEVREAVDRLVDKLEASGLPMSQLHLFFLELFTCLLRLSRGSGLDLDEVFGPGFMGTVQAMDFNSPQELGAWCRDRCLRIWELIRSQRTDSAWRAIERAKDYIAGHFSDSDLSVETLCRYLHLSPAYFSTLFKRETGMSFTAYVTEVRMNEAAALLRGTEEKTYIIAEKTGYPDPNYFSYVFKKRFGVSPTKYRAE